MNGSAAGINHNQLMQTATPDAIVKAAANVPASDRNNYYIQASQKATNEGNLDLAERIIDENIKEPDAREQGFSNVANNFVNSGKLDQAENIINTKLENPASKNNALSYLNDHKFMASIEKSKLDEAAS